MIQSVINIVSTEVKITLMQATCSLLTIIKKLISLYFLIFISSYELGRFVNFKLREELKGKI